MAYSPMPLGLYLVEGTHVVDDCCGAVVAGGLPDALERPQPTLPLCDTLKRKMEELCRELGAQGK